MRQNAVLCGNGLKGHYPVGCGFYGCLILWCLVRRNALWGFISKYIYFTLIEKQILTTLKCGIVW